MTEKDLLEGKRVLVVDDEEDILDSLEELLSMCHVVKASNFKEGKQKLENQSFDIAILDIMGVEGYQLLGIAKQRNILAGMLTAHALSPEETKRSFLKGAAFYVPKEKLASIRTYLNDVLEAKSEGKSFWWRWLERFGSFYDEKFGSDWKYKDKDFWRTFPYL